MDKRRIVRQPVPPRISPSIFDKGWVVGFIEGEATFGRSGPGKYEVFVRATQANLEPLQRMQSYFGGQISPIKKVKPHHQQAYAWELASHAAIDLLLWVFPHLSSKRQNQVSHTWRLDFIDESRPFRYEFRRCHAARVLERWQARNNFEMTDPRVIHEMYWNNGMSVVDLARHFLVGRHVILDFLRQHDIPQRSWSASAFLRESKEGKAAKAGKRPEESPEATRLAQQFILQEPTPEEVEQTALHVANHPPFVGK